MKNLLLLISLLFSFSAAAQDSKKLGFFTTAETHVGFDLAAMIRPQPQTPYEIEKSDPGKFTYGFSGLAGYQPFSWFSLAGGLRYSFIDPNFHLVYYKLQTNFYVGDKAEEDFLFIFANFGEKINRTAAQNAGFIGLGVGKIEPLGERFGHHFQLGLDVQVTDGESAVFVGLSYGIILFSRKSH